MSLKLLKKKKKSSSFTYRVDVGAKFPRIHPQRQTGIFLDFPTRVVNRSTCIGIPAVLGFDNPVSKSLSLFRKTNSPTVRHDIRLPKPLSKFRLNKSDGVTRFAILDKENPSSPSSDANRALHTKPQREFPYKKRG
ncbi:hypothetical protein NPIL_106751 [Nephila pilipes]|uniref:Uncharacterized protein n=1 Tax=Nephila pilipes TaxID=299642 RepID=A0A8X6TZC0_NEPPI|nr:hypothetical protein NPIL_106751 [Nephila pilipes]